MLILILRNESSLPRRPSQDLRVTCRPKSDVLGANYVHFRTTCQNGVIEIAVKALVGQEAKHDTLPPVPPGQQSFAKAVAIRAGLNRLAEFLRGLPPLYQVGFDFGRMTQIISDCRIDVG